MGVYRFRATRFYRMRGRFLSFCHISVSGVVFAAFIKLDPGVIKMMRSNEGVKKSGSRAR